MIKSFFATGLQWLWLVLLVMAIDFASKRWVINHLVLHETMPMIPFLNLFYTRNYGIVFGVLANNNGWQRWLFIGIAVAIVAVVLMIMFRTIANQKLNNISYALIIGGALGNLIDRTWNGFVIDFIDFYIGDWHFATFNIADCSICIGVILNVLADFFTVSNKFMK